MPKKKTVALPTEQRRGVPLGHLIYYKWWITLVRTDRDLSKPNDPDVVIDRMLKAGVFGQVKRDVGREMLAGKLKQPKANHVLLTQLKGQSWLYLDSYLEAGELARKTGLTTLLAGYDDTGGNIFLHLYEGTNERIAFDSEGFTKDEASPSDAKFKSDRHKKNWWRQFEDETVAVDALARELDAYVPWVEYFGSSRTVGITFTDEAGDVPAEDFLRVDLLVESTEQSEPLEEPEEPIHASESQADSKSQSRPSKSPARPARPPIVPSEMIAACRNGRVEKVRKHVEAGMSVNGVEQRDGHRPLTAAAAAGQLEVVRFLLDMGADPDSQNYFEKPALVLAATKGHLAVVKLLLDRGADVNLQGSTWAAIAEAAQAGHFAVVKELMSRGAKPGSQGWDALLCAVNRGHEDIAMFMLDHGWPPSPEALECALREGTLKLVKRLIAAGATCSHELLCLAVHWEKEPEALELIRAGAPIWPKSECSVWCPLHNAVKNGLARVVRAVIDTKADLSRRDDIEFIEPLSPQARKTAKSKGRRRKPEEVMARQTTAMIVGVRCNRKEMIQLLLKGGADCNATDADGMTPMDWAMKLGRTDMIPLLKRAGATSTSIEASVRRPKQR